MKILVKTVKTGKAKTLLVFHLKERKVNKIDVKIPMLPTHLFELVKKIETKLIEFSELEDKRLDLEAEKLYFLKQQTKTFDLPKAQNYQHNIKIWNSLYEQYMSNIYGDVPPAENSLFQRKKYESDFMESFFKSEEWYAKDKTIARFCANEKNLLSSIHQNQPKNYEQQSYSEDRLL